LIDRRVAALPSSQDLTGPPLGDEPRALKGRRGGTDEFLGRGIAVPQSPGLSRTGGRPLDKCLVQLHADATIRKSLAAVREAVNSGPVITPRKKNYSSPVRGAPVDRRGHIRVRHSQRSVLKSDYAEAFLMSLPQVIAELLPFRLDLLTPVSHFCIPFLANLLSREEENVGEAIRPGDRQE